MACRRTPSRWAITSWRGSTLATRHPLIGTVHGSGLYMGVELVSDRTTLEPAVAETAAICERMRELG